LTNTNTNSADSAQAAAKAYAEAEAARKAADAQKQKQYRERKKAERREATSKELIRRCADFGLVMPEGIQTDENGKVKDTLDNCYCILAGQEWGFAFDELAQEHVFRGEVIWPDHYGRVLTDKLTLAIRLQMIDVFGVEFSMKQVEESIVALCNANPFSPVAEYLESVRPRWDGVKRVEKMLHKYFGAKDTRYHSAVGAVFMVGAVARAMQPGCKHDSMMILEGPQGSGKSTALSILGGEWYSDAELGNLKDKDAAMVLRSIWIQEIPELASMRRADMNTLKAFVTRQVDRYRPTRANLPINQPRSCLFVGTYNPDGNDGYLTDASGNRRFQPVVTGKIDLKALAADRDQLWAEAAQMFADGYSTVMPSDLWIEAAAIAAERMPDDSWAAMLAKHADDIAVGGKVPTQKVLSEWIGIDNERQTRADAARIAPLMRSLGFAKTQIGKACVRGWEKLPEPKVTADADTPASMQASQAAPYRDSPDSALPPFPLR
jgi:predicted P-loop ATPase